MTTFSKLIEEDQVALNPGTVLVVDALNLCFRWKHSGQLMFVSEFLKTVKSLAKSYDCGKIIITADWGSSSYRKELYPEYKANRDYSDQTEKEAKEFKLFFKEYEAALLKASESEDFLVLRYKGVEADDLAAYIAKQYPGEIWMMSSDRDWDLMVNEKVSRFSYVTRKETTLLTWDEHYEVTPEQYISYKCLMGDSGDNIPGISGVGPKKAKDLIDTYGTAYDVYSHCPIDSKYKYIQTLNENCEQILLNYELMDLYTYCEDAIGADNLLDVDTKLQEYLV